MRECLLWLCCASVLMGGSVQGVVLDWASGKPLSRTVVLLTPVPGSANSVRPFQLRSGPAGSFLFSGVPPGLYLLEARREGFLPVAHGQRRPEGHGRPLTITAESNTFSELRMHRVGAITGTVLDENGIGIPRVGVVAYEASLPLRTAGQGTSDDRGVFRISGLTLGKYWVRSMGHTLDDGTMLLPRFAPDGQEPHDAIPYTVRYDNDTTDANVRPVPGNLSTLSGTIGCDAAPNTPVKVTLSSELMRREVDGACMGGFQFTALPPAHYEILIGYLDGSGFGFGEHQVSQNIKTVVQVTSLSAGGFTVFSAESRARLNTRIKLAGRRDDRFGPGPPVEFPFPLASVAPGYWEIAGSVGPNQYVDRISSGRGVWQRPGHNTMPAEGFPVHITPMGNYQVYISDRAGAISGVVKEDGRASPGAPVYRWPVDEVNRRRLAGWKEQLAAADGSFRFTGLPPGEYRILATFDTRRISQEIVEEYKADTLAIVAGQSANAEVSVRLSP